ncbi:hypothetical protein R1sor_025369 [Riccia sorocarpa]|uniref:Inosine/uridine-preferring nucleoside hydrolase domain-containing protein n=1 Tax=Riccia sorocarpa TaxID=122646 RepID=A0ABD3GA07_9MARC
MGPPRRKLIIDTDPGIDDAMAILMAFQSPEVEVIGLTTVFGNVPTPIATTNALYLCALADCPEVPVAEGAWAPLTKSEPTRISDYAHGEDGFGNTHVANPGFVKAEKVDQSACDFLIEKVAQHPGEVTVVALGPLTNLALAVRKDPSFVKNVKELCILGGAFFASGNVNPAAEFNIYSDPDAADIVFTAGMNTRVIGINLTTQVILNDKELTDIKDSGTKYGKYVHDITRFYMYWHVTSDGVDGIFLHDPTCMAAVLDPSLVTYRTGVVRVETQGICAGLTLLDMGLKGWNSSNLWMHQPPIKVGWTVEANRVKELVKNLLTKP